ncbi:hypothetical protein POM88_044261 [Heracleum sosnowskyi]|uniref:Ubiquitin-like protease family profile domain-containing protein n=1 Tax=Heracleum sosnowskyi TaxID=360622 RepID=A0AAD8H536_9APIA|nr:hypothetical protein POM88_044261 [Heracleum sosnowskyi]
MVDSDASNSGDRDDILNVMNEELHDHPDMREMLKDDSALPLWPGCTKFSKLSAVLTLYNLKFGHQFSDVFFTAMLTAVSELLPEGNVIPLIFLDMGGLYWNVGPWHEHINKENILEVLDAQWLSASSLVFYIRYLSEVFLSKNPDLTAKFSFVSPHLVSQLVDNSDINLAKCLLGHIDKDHLLLMPYNVSKHWVLVAIIAKTEMIYYMDPARMTNAINYKQESESACRNCPKQALDDGIYCAYYAGCFIEDILCTGETTINVNFSYSPRLKTYPRDKMLCFQTNWAGYMYNRFLKNKLLMK